MRTISSESATVTEPVTATESATVTETATATESATANATATATGVPPLRWTVPQALTAPHALVSSAVVASSPSETSTATRIHACSSPSPPRGAEHAGRREADGTRPRKRYRGGRSLHLFSSDSESESNSSGPGLRDDPSRLHRPRRNHAIAPAFLGPIERRVCPR